MYKDLVDEKGEYNTPLYLFNYLNKHFKFDIDPCGDAKGWLNRPITYTKADINGLEAEWQLNAFVNPPYGSNNEEKWIEKCINESIKHNTANFILLPSKTEAKWFAKAMILASIVIFPQGRIQFMKDGKTMNGNTMGSVIFGFFKWNNCFTDATKVGNQAASFMKENSKLGIPYVFEEQRVILFPSRDLLKEKYSN